MIVFRMEQETYIYCMNLRRRLWTERLKSELIVWISDVWFQTRARTSEIQTISLDFRQCQCLKSEQLVWARTSEIRIIQKPNTFLFGLPSRTFIFRRFTVVHLAQSIKIVLKLKDSLFLHAQLFIGWLERVTILHLFSCNFIWTV